MFRLPQFVGLIVMALALVVSVSESQEKDKKKDDKGKKKEVKKDTLPQFFKDLGLSDEQKTKIAGIQKEFAPKVGELQKQVGELNKKIGALKKDEFSGILGVLDADQKKKYDELVANAKKKKDAPKDKKKEEKKDDKK